MAAVPRSFIKFGLAAAATNMSGAACNSFVVNEFEQNANKHTQNETVVQPANAFIVDYACHNFIYVSSVLQRMHALLMVKRQKGGEVS